MKIAVDNEHIRTSGSAVRFDDIAEVSAEKVDKVTYDEVFLIVRDQSGRAIALGELDEGFAEAQQALKTHLAGFPRSWRAAAEQGPAGYRKRVWAAEA